MSRRSNVLVAFAGISGGVLGGRAIPILFRDGGNLSQKVHWMGYGYDRVWYHNRSYIDPSQPISLATLEQTYGQGGKFIPTGQTVIGLPVYNNPARAGVRKA